ncbi:MAG: acetyl-CoA carboxylase biotin carboxyl carrier protein [Bdellovibrionota bacterium]|nr:MAG: acetyl-CoA carboxylase biotin carboxyl carrier protein [Bdellovibrionota bacterium]
MDITDLAKIIAILKENGVTEFELEQEGTHIKLARSAITAGNGVNERYAVVQPAIPAAANPLPLAATNGSAGASVNSDHLSKVESPIVGTFYSRPAPDKDPFVKPGATVKKGDTLCIVEAMKLMNEIEAPCSGKVEKILAGDGQVVEFGEVLFLIDPKG